MTPPDIPQRHTSHDALPERRTFETLPTGDSIPYTPDTLTGPDGEISLRQEVFALRSLLGRYAGRVNDQSEYIKELHREVAYDPLTGAFREPVFRALVEADQRAIAAHRRRNPAAPPVYRALIAIDNGNQKLVNERLGQAGGDAVLMMLPGLLRRGSDWVARIGGDEFLAYTDVTPQVEGQTPTEVLGMQLAYIAGLRNPIIQRYPILDQGSIRFFVGAGGVLYDHASGYAANRAVADRALYAAKRFQSSIYGKYRTAE